MWPRLRSLLRLLEDAATERNRINMVLDDLKREVAETKLAVTGVVTELAALTARVAALLSVIQAAPTEAELAAAATALDLEQQRLAIVKTALAGLGVTPPVTPPPAP